MATAQQQRAPQTTTNQPQQATVQSNEFERLLNRSVKYRPVGSDDEINLTPRMVLEHFAEPTRSGKMPTVHDAVKFVMLCKSQRLNPWLKECFLVGYDTGGDAKFELIGSYKALCSRAEKNPQYDGIEAGIVVVKEGKPNEPITREGEIILPDETLIGGWP